MTRYQVILQDAAGQEIGHGSTHAFMSTAEIECELRAERVPLPGVEYDVKIVDGADQDDAAALSDLRAMTDVCNLWGWM